MNRSFFIPAFFFRSDLNIICIADTHGAFKVYHPDKPKIPYKIDGIFLLGDIFETDLLEIMKMFPDLPIHAIYGNHEPIMLYEKYHIPVIHERVLKIREYTLTGWSGAYKYKSGQSYGLTQAESIELSRRMPSADIMLSHDCPFNVYDKGLKDTHPSLVGILKYLLNKRCHLHMHGHIHDDAHYTKIKGIPSVCIYTMSHIRIHKGRVSFFDY